MRAAILAIGSELLGTTRLDTNSLRLTAVLERYGVELVGKSVIGDDEAAIAAELERRIATVDLMLVTGGLGPTADDVTRSATATALGREITVDEEVVAAIRQRFASLGRRMAEVNRRQAEVIAGAEILTNTHGTAPGMRLEEGTATIFLFPGVPHELEHLISVHLEPWLEAQTAASGTAERVERSLLKLACVSESDVEQRLAPAYERFGRDPIAVLASPGEIQIHLAARGSPAERRAKLEAMRRHIRELAGEAVFVEDRDDTLEAVVATLLDRDGATVSTAESCTGGLLAERLTRVPGSSGYFHGGVVAYSNEFKTRLLGISEELIATAGAVSEPVARAMAQGVRTRYGTDFGIGITGIAGPGGGTDAKPVGTVHIAVAGPDDDAIEHRRRRFPGDRQRVRWQTSQLALEMLRRILRARVPRSPEAGEKPTMAQTGAT